MSGTAEAKVNPSKDEKPATPVSGAIRRPIPGNFSYTPSHGRLRDALNGIVKAERPDKVSGDFVETVLVSQAGLEELSHPF